MKLIINDKNKRLNEIKRFLKSQNIPLNSLNKIKGDASFRQYYRINGKELLLMDADPKTNEKISSFIKIQKILSQMKIKVPKIYKKNISLGLMLIEDFGEENFLTYKNKNEIISKFYRDSIEILLRIHRLSILMPNKIKSLKKYSQVEQKKETDLFFDWYLKKHINVDLAAREKEKFYNILNKLCKKMFVKNYSLVLRDYHVDNIIPIKAKSLFPKQGGLITSFEKKNSENYDLGIIDFQDALIGSPAYDLCSLVEDVRAPLDELEKQNLVDRFILSAKMDLTMINQKAINETRDFVNSDTIKIAENTIKNLNKQISYFSIQRNLKIIGIFCRLKYRDKKPNYIKYLPAAKKFINNNLKKPDFVELKNWFTMNKIDV